MYYSLSFIQPPNPRVFNRNTADLTPPLDLELARNTWQHWQIVPTSRPAFAPPPLNTHTVNVDGANGYIDLTQALTGYPTYGNRTGSIEFAVINDYRNWQEAYTDIMTTIHGKRLYCVYEEDPEWYYVGRWTVSSWSTGKTRSTLVLDYDLEPYKLRLYDLNSAWLWDPFNFQSGFISSRSSGDTGAFNTKSARVDSEIGADYTSIIDTRIIHGDNVTDPIGDGYLHELELRSAAIGNMPVAIELGVYVDEGSSIELRFYNDELGYGSLNHGFKTYTANYIGTDPSYIVTNYSGVNSIFLSAAGHGRVSANFRPGRL